MIRVVFFLTALASAHPSIEWVPESGEIAVRGLPPSVIASLSQAKLTPGEWTDVFSIRVLSEGRETPAMWGSYALSADSVWFRPRFGLRPGVSYVVSFTPARLPAHLGEGLEPIIDRIALPAEPLPASTVVEAVYPSGDSLPENLLRFYVHFSAPMRRGTAYRFIHLRSEGREVELPFLELDEELWDPDARRLTLLLDPGRIKRGLVPHEDVGAPLVAGRRYRLTIDRDWRDARGAPLREGHDKSFVATIADRQSPLPKAWLITKPRAGSRDTLRVLLDEPLDRALLHRLIWIESEGDTALAGERHVREHEAVWEFVPERDWRAVSHQLRVSPALEDRAGNSVGRPFEVMNAPAAELAPEPLTLPFVPLAPDAKR